MRPALIALLMATPAAPVTGPTTDRFIGREPKYAGTPRYGLLLLGPAGRDRVWLVHDGANLYIDANGDGDLTGEDEGEARAAPELAKNGGAFEVTGAAIGGRTYPRIGLRVFPAMPGAPAGPDGGPAVEVTATADVPGLPGGPLPLRAGWHPVYIRDVGVLTFAPTPGAAPVIRAGGALAAALRDPKPRLYLGRHAIAAVAVGSPGEGKGTLAYPSGRSVPLEVVLDGTFAGERGELRTSERRQFALGQPSHFVIRTPPGTKPGRATLTLSLVGQPAWAAPPIRYELEVRAPTPQPPPEPASPNLIASLRAPGRRPVSFHRVEFSPDGSRLRALSTSPGDVVVWDVATRAVVRHVEARPPSGGHVLSATPSPDWKTLYLPIGLPPKPGGGAAGEFGGEIRVWNLETGEPKPPIRLPASPIAVASVSPDGRALELILTKPPPGAMHNRVLIDVATGDRRPFGESASWTLFSAERGVAFRCANGPKGNDQIWRRDLPPVQERERVDIPGRAPTAALSPDGARLAAWVLPRGGATQEIWLFDARTLEKRAALPLPAADGWASRSLLFSPDGRWLVAPSQDGRVRVWGAATGGTPRTVELGGMPAGEAAIAAGRTALAAVWMFPPKLEPGEPPPPVSPGSRVTVAAYDGAEPPRTLVLPPGWNTSPALSPDGKLLAVAGTGAVHLFDLTR